MDSAYFKRFRMEAPLGSEREEFALPAGYRFVPWHDGLLDAHARTKYRSFRSEIDAVVFPCLGDLEGCRRLMREIRGKAGFLPAATWLVARSRPPHLPASEQPPHLHQQPVEVDWCATIQGVVDNAGVGSIQNVGVVPSHRGLGLGTALIERAILGFAGLGVGRVSLEVTVDNARAVRLYQRLGFRRVKTIYKVVDGPSWQLGEREPALL
ncbi:MAG: N-acetyltransferase [Planctomycetota bacterium]|nr:MAG: N-acetyltransferase [Planctomycetota bacterium]